jgi:hypothetical protein
MKTAFQIRRPYVGTATLLAKKDGIELFNNGGSGSPSVLCKLPAVTTHAAVLCASTGAVIAMTGSACDAESVEFAHLFAAARALLFAAQTARDVVAWALEGRAPFPAAVLADLDSAIEAATGANNPANYAPLPAGEATELHPIIADALFPLMERLKRSLA